MTLKIGHRGAMGHAPENTLSSFQKAIELSVDMVEFDVQRCRSGEMVVIHDSTVNRTTNGQGAVQDMTLTALKTLTIPPNETIPTLTEVLDLIDHRMAVNIEIKQAGLTQDISMIIEHYVQQKNWSYSDFLVSSFYHSELHILSRLNPKIPLGILIEFHTDLVQKIKYIPAYSLHPLLNLVDEHLIAQAHALDLKVFVWPVNQPSDIKKIKALGADGIFSDYPERI